MDLKSLFIFDGLSKFVGFFVLFFGAVLFFYSLGFIKERKGSYYLWYFLTLASSLGAVFSKDLILLLVFWGFLGLTLFKLINLYSNKDASFWAKKTFIIIGGSDGFLLLGILLYFILSSDSLINSRIPIDSKLAFSAFIFLCIGAFAKAGCMPFHTWIPGTCQYAPLPAVAYLPASLDKLLGIYLLARVVKDMFVLSDASRALLLFLGALTVISAVMMALVQHNIKRLLGFHAVSQVGYMVLGLGCGTPLGIAGGLFHMLNNAIYKSCLFLGAGNVQHQTGKDSIEDLGGLARFMPFTFIFTLIASLSISGIPPFNGFISKWMVYQGLVDLLGRTPNNFLKILISGSLVLAIIGSGLTLASFVKLLSGVFLGKEKTRAKEVKSILYIPQGILAGLCIVLGIFFYQTVLPYLIKITGDFELLGIWKPALSTNFIIAGIILGLILLKFMGSKTRISPVFIGGRTLDSQADVRVEDFYEGFKDLGFLRKIYVWAQKGFFDIYEQIKNFTFVFVRFLRYLHNGVLPTYLVWSLLGMMGLFWVFFK